MLIITFNFSIAFFLLAIVYFIKSYIVFRKTLEYTTKNKIKEAKKKLELFIKFTKLTDFYIKGFFVNLFITLFLAIFYGG